MQTKKKMNYLQHTQGLLSVFLRHNMRIAKISLRRFVMNGWQVNLVLFSEMLNTDNFLNKTIIYKVNVSIIILN